MTGPTISLENSDSGTAAPSGLAGFADAILEIPELSWWLQFWSEEICVRSQRCVGTCLANLVGSMLGSRHVDGGYDIGMFGNGNALSQRHDQKVNNVSLRKHSDSYNNKGLPVIVCDLYYGSQYEAANSKR